LLGLYLYIFINWLLFCSILYLVYYSTSFNSGDFYYLASFFITGSNSTFFMRLLLYTFMKLFALLPLWCPNTWVWLKMFVSGFYSVIFGSSIILAWLSIIGSLVTCGTSRSAFRIISSFSCESALNFYLPLSIEWIFQFSFLGVDCCFWEFLASRGEAVVES